MSHCKEVRPGTWRAWIEIPRSAEEPGKRRQRCITFQAAGKREADKLVAKMITDAQSGKLASPTQETVSSYIAAWLDKREGDLAPKTLETWRDFLRAYIDPNVGPTKLEKLTPKMVDDFYAKLRKSGRRRSKGGLSARSVLHVHRLLSEAMRSAVRLQLISQNPCDGVSPKGVFVEERIVVRQYSQERIAQLLELVRGHWLEIPVLLAMTMGMRRGECLGLRWAQVDLAEGTLTVNASLQQLRGQAPSIKKPKRERTRDLTMPACLVDSLRRHKGAQASHRLQFPDCWEDNGLVVANELGQPRLPDTLTQAFAKLIRDSQLPKITFHDLRHVNATALLLAGVDDKVVAGRLGHSTTQITRDLYQHILPQMDQHAAERADDFFRRAVNG